jgi:Outer membrane protein beta-barrel domain
LLTRWATIFASQELFMKKVFLAVVAITICLFSFAQKKKDWSKVNLVDRTGDHIMLQAATNYWTGMPDSISSHKKGISRSGNIYIMLDKPFKTDPRFSVAFGVGIGTASMNFSKMSVDIKNPTSVKVPFNNLDSFSRFKKYKLATAYLEAPIEIRYTSNPIKPNKSIKVALGVKVGTLINAHTKGKIFETASGQVLNNYTLKESSKRYFNTTRLSATARFGYGNFSLFGSYQINNLFKDGLAADIKPYQIGLCISGL